MQQGSEADTMADIIRGSMFVMGMIADLRCAGCHAGTTSGFICIGSDDQHNWRCAGWHCNCTYARLPLIEPIS